MPSDAGRGHSPPARVRARLDGFYDAAAGGEISPAALARVERTLTSELNALEARSRQLSSSSTLGPAVGLDLDGWRALPIGTRRETLRLLMTIVFEPVGRGRRTFDPRSLRIEWKASSGASVD